MRLWEKIQKLLPKAHPAVHPRGLAAAPRGDAGLGPLGEEGLVTSNWFTCDRCATSTEVGHMHGIVETKVEIKKYCPSCWKMMVIKGKY